MLPTIVVISLVVLKPVKLTNKLKRFKIFIILALSMYNGAIEEDVYVFLVGCSRGCITLIIPHLN